MPFVYGKHVVEEFLTSKEEDIKKLLIAKDCGKEFNELVKQAREKKIFIEFCEWKKLDSITGRALHQGIAVEVTNLKSDKTVQEILQSAKQKNETPLIVILDRIQDPQNLGSIIRTSVAVGVHGVVVPKMHSAKLTPSAVKASGGASAHIELAEVPNIVNAMEELKDNGVHIIGTDANSKIVYTSVNLKEPVAFVIGNEGEGLRKLVKEHCDILVKIPIREVVNSLNVSVATAVLLYEVSRQRG